jgi:hypothetical protein
MTLGQNLKLWLPSACIGIILPLVCSYADDASFFPEGPKNQAVRTTTGVLVDYGIGNKSGSFLVRDNSGTEKSFYTSWPMNIGGKPVTCSVPPLDDYKPDSSLCKDWPNSIKLGKTRVEVYYWQVEKGGKSAFVSNRIEPLPSQGLATDPLIPPISTVPVAKLEPQGRTYTFRLGSSQECPTTDWTITRTKDNGLTGTVRWEDLQSTTMASGNVHGGVNFEITARGPEGSARLASLKGTFDQVGQLTAQSFTMHAAGCTAPSKPEVWLVPIGPND